MRGTIAETNQTFAKMLTLYKRLKHYLTHSVPVKGFDEKIYMMIYSFDYITFTTHDNGQNWLVC